MIRILTLIAVLLALGACSLASDDSVRRALVARGYTDVEVTGAQWRPCGWMCTGVDGFTATSPSGQPVTGTVTTFMDGSERIGID